MLRNRLYICHFSVGPDTLPPSGSAHDASTKTLVGTYRCAGSSCSSGEGKGMIYMYVNSFYDNSFYDNQRGAQRLSG